MTPFEKEMKQAVDGICDYTYADISAEELFGKCGEVAKKYIEKAWDFRGEAMWSSNSEIAFKTKEQWLKENGIV
jgi:hypothetical protein